MNSATVPTAHQRWSGAAEINSGANGLSQPTERKRSGSYYTPERLALPMARWVLTSEPASVLDPSAGPGVFLKTIISAATERCVSVSPYGIDRDPRILNGVWKLPDAGIPESNLLNADFFKVRPENGNWGTFDAVIGNPPYIRHHLAPDEEIDLARAAIANHDVQLSRRADMWAYFVLHATSFLSDHGSLAFVLPYASLTAEYAQPVINYLSARFDSVNLVRIRERFFDDAREGTTILACAGWNAGTTAPQRIDIETAGDLPDVLAPTSTVANQATGGSWLPGEAHELLRSFAAAKQVVPLDHLATIKIGVVTGANKYFILPENDPVSKRANSCRIITRAKYLKGLTWTTADEQALTSSATPSVLIMPTSPHSKVVDDYLSSPLANSIKSRSHCTRRNPWYRVRDVERPDGFLRYMGSSPGWILPNSGAATCTNTIHRLFWKPPARGSEIAVSVGSMTSLFGLSQEYEGRAYGGGVLKVEPSEARRCLVPVVSVTLEDAQRIDTLLRQADYENARDLADQIVLQQAMGLSQNAVTQIRALADNMRHRRGPLPPTNSKGNQ